MDRIIVYESATGTIVAHHEYVSPPTQAEKDKMTAAGLAFCVAQNTDSGKLQDREVGVGSVAADSTLSWNTTKFPRRGRIVAETPLTVASGAKAVDLTFKAKNYDGTDDTSEGGTVDWYAQFDGSDFDSGKATLVNGVVTVKVDMPAMLVVGDSVTDLVFVRCEAGTRVPAGSITQLVDDS
jgi:hypothetical protein